MIDTHVHCNYSKDCRFSVREMAKSAYERGLGGICITTHFEPARLSPERNTILVETIPEYLREVEKADAEFPIEVLCGLEVGYEPEKERLVGKVLGEFSFDYAIGSIHFMGGIPASDSRGGRLLYKKMGDGFFPAYFEKMDGLVDSGLFDAVGHFDVVCKGPALEGEETIEKYRERALESIGKMRKGGMPFEFNSGGYDWVGRPYPHPCLVSEMVGLPVLFGSDSHSVDEVGRHSGEAVELLKEIGFDELSYFVQRKRKTYPI